MGKSEARNRFRGLEMENKKRIDRFGKEQVFFFWRQGSVGWHCLMLIAAKAVSRRFSCKWRRRSVDVRM